MVGDAFQDWIEKGNTLRSQGKYYDSIGAFDKAIELEPNDPTAWVKKVASLCLCQKRDIPAAYKCYREAVSRVPNFVPAWEDEVNAHGHCFDLVNNLLKAHHLLDPLTDKGMALKSKGEDLIRAGLYADSFGVLNKAISFDPLSSESWYLMTIAQLCLGNYDDAARCYDRAINICPNNTKWISLNRLREYSEILLHTPPGDEKYSENGDLLSVLKVLYNQKFMKYSDADSEAKAEPENDHY